MVVQRIGTGVSPCYTGRLRIINHKVLPMHFLTEWGLFLLDTLTIVIAIIVVLLAISAIAGKNKSHHPKGKLKVKKLNKDFEETIDLVQRETLSKDALKKLKKAHKKNKKKDKGEKPKLFVIDFCGDIKASAVGMLTECINAILLTASKDDQVLLRLESPGGIVPGYGLGASQLQRLRDANIHLTIAVDKVAASGGYMMACIANKIIAAPFAIIGSIGVVYQLPNFNRLLHKKAIDFELLTAGTYKRTLTMFGENTKEDRKKVQQEIDETQVLFKQHIVSHRSHVDIDKVATGEHWYGTQALPLNLIDKIQTSDDFILETKETFDIFSLHFKRKQKLGQKIVGGLSNLYTKFIEHQYYEHT